MKTLKQILEERNITQASFSRSIEVTPQVLGNWFLRGDIPKDFIKPVARELKLSLDVAIDLKASNIERKKKGRRWKESLKELF